MNGEQRYLTGTDRAATSAGCGGEVTVAAVTQAELATFFELKEWVRRHGAMRQELLNSLGAGALVETGPLQVRVEQRQCRLLSAKALKPVLGPKGFEDLLDRVEPTLVHYLILEGTPVGGR